MTRRQAEAQQVHRPPPAVVCIEGLPSWYSALVAKEPAQARDSEVARDLWTNHNNQYLLPPHLGNDDMLSAQAHWHAGFAWSKFRKLGAKIWEKSTKYGF